MKPLLVGLSSLLALLVAAGCGAKRTPLNNAIVAGDAAGVTRLLDNGAPLDELGDCGNSGDDTPLTCAIRKSRQDIARLLIDRGADIRKPAESGCPPIHYAAADDVGAVRLLLDKGADAGGSCPGGWGTALYGAAWNGKADVVRLLFERGAVIDPKTNDSLALYVAAYRQNREVVKILISKGADVDSAISKAESDARKYPKGKEKEFSAIRLLNELRSSVPACSLRFRPDPAAVAAFPDTVSRYRSTRVKPELPEEARVFRVQAEDAVSRKRFQDAVDLYGKALKISPWWPEGHFNQALLLGESDCPEEAIAAMERYLSLVPDAPDARAARDKVYLWRGRLP